MGKVSFVRSAGVIGACILLSRILGLGRDVLCAHTFGAGMLWDAFALAFVIPNLFRRLFGEGALTGAFLPTFVERLDSGRKEEAHALLNRLVTAVGLLLGLLAAAGIGFTFILPAFWTGEKAELFARLLRIMLPYLVFICVAGLLGAALNATRHFFTPAFSPVLLNVVWIGTVLIFTRNIEMLAWAVLIGGALQMLIMLPPLAARKLPIRPRFDLGDPTLRTVGGRFLPLAFGLALVQIHEVVARIIAETVPGDGAVSAIYYGNQLTQFPLALIGTAMATAVFPLFTSPKEDFRDVFQKSLRLVLFVSIPATVGLVLLAEPISALLYERGNFSPEDTVRTAGVVGLYSLGLWCFCSNQIQVRAFYAKHDTRTPVKVSGVMVLLNVTLCLTLVGPLQERGIALANAVTGLCTFIALNVLLRRRHGDLGLKTVFGGLARTLPAAALMGAAVWGVSRLMVAGPGATLGPKALAALVPVAAGIAVYLLLARILRMDELKLLLRRSHEDR